MPKSQDEADAIEDKATEPVAKANEQARQAWRGWVISRRWFNGFLFLNVNQRISQLQDLRISHPHFH